MEAIFISGLAGLTSIGMYLCAILWLRLPAGKLGAALAKMLESVGTTLVFLALNVTVAVSTVLAVRGFTKTFVSVYISDDAALVGLSILQGLTFQWWRELSRGLPSSR